MADAEKICQRIVSAKGKFFDAVHLLAVIQMSLGKNDLALVNLDRALAMRPNDVDALVNRGTALKLLNRREEALASFERAMAVRPDNIRAHFNHAAALHELKRLEEAVAGYDHLLLAQPDNVDIHNNRGAALHGMGRFAEALESYNRALALRPDHAEVLNNRGATQRELRRLDDALGSFERAILAKPDHAHALNNHGNILKEMKRHDEALRSYDRALTARENFADPMNNRGVVLNALERYEEALASFDRALALKPESIEFRNNRGTALLGLNRLDDALAAFDSVIAAQPAHPEAHNNRGMTLNKMKRLEEALASYDHALAARPDYADALCRRGSLLEELKRLDDALASFDRALAFDPNSSHALGGAASCAAKLCDWPMRAKIAAALPQHIRDAGGFIAPFVLLGYSDDPRLQLECSRNYFANHVRALPPPVWTGEVWRHDKIRVAYLSSDYRVHPMGHLLADFLETHDRSFFEIVGISHGVDDGSDIRKRIVAAFDTFHDVRGMDDEQVARLLRDLEIDIAVDLQGYTGLERIGMFARRPAPISASYIGYPGTMGAPFLDYIIADRIVAPFERQEFFTEKIVHLPDSYLPIDRKRAISPRALTRAEMGLPEQGFVFCSFHSSWKITPVLFDIWMQLLRRIEGSVLWLVGDNKTLRWNLTREAERRGVDRSRLIFARRLAGDEHMARHALADLFLDTLPYNAHSTGSDALRAGLPIVTCIGEAFPARVASSQLHAIGLPELVVSNLDDYRALALKLATDPTALATIRAKLLKHRDTYPLLDTERLTRHLEAAYRTMWEVWQRGEGPRSFSVPAQ
jgi:predicted O-linked N-acetylglucosamine transferase (SPINDLY family)